MPEVCPRTGDNCTHRRMPRSCRHFIRMQRAVEAETEEALVNYLAVARNQPDILYRALIKQEVDG